MRFIDSVHIIVYMFLYMVNKLLTYYNITLPHVFSNESTFNQPKHKEIIGFAGKIYKCIPMTLYM